ncbi:DUF5071 domain-containing protein [Flavobacterium sp. LaA7.5]|nr:DUF5071 domain-containing protein [Flavobacterium salilacus subsp. altitudinum]
MNLNIIPKDKEDLNFVEVLFSMDIDEVKDEVPLLLKWIKDGNWPQAPYIYQYFIPHVNEIEDEVIKILKSNDELWKYWLINGLLFKSKHRPSNLIMKELEYLYNNPTEDEKEAEVDISAFEVINKFGGNVSD